MAIASINPATGETVATFEAHDDAEIERRIAQSRAAFEQLRGTTYAQRAQWMIAAADLMEAEVEEAAAMMTISIPRREVRVVEVCITVEFPYPDIRRRKRPAR